MKIIHITDTHIIPEGQTIYGLDPAARLATVIDDICDRQADADLVVITGDLTDRGDAASYKRLSELLARLPMPVRLLIGNHDSRAAFVAIFPETPRDEFGFVQSAIDLPDGAGRLVFLDTNEPGWSGGRYCDKRLDWLTTRLQEAADRRAYVFMHHPPFDLGVAHFEAICLAEPAAFLDVLARHKGGVGHLFLGHMHLTMNGVSPTGIPFSAGKGSNHQMILDPDAKDCTWTEGRPSYNIILIRARGVFVHAVDVIGDPPIGIGAYPPGP